MIVIFNYKIIAKRSVPKKMKEKRQRNFRILEFKSNQYDIIGDIHGCYKEFMALLKKLGYEKGEKAYFHPQGRRLISVGDIADKGYENIACLEFWINQVQYGGGFWVHGNHCNKLYRYFLGNKVHISHGLENTVKELAKLSADERESLKRRYLDCYESQCYYLLLDKKRLAVVHGGLKEEAMGKCNNAIKKICLYGETTGRFFENGRPERLDWALQYKGKTLVVYGHTVTAQPVIINHTVDIDQGCVYGGYLTAMRYPEMEFIQVKGKAYAKYMGQTDTFFLNNMQ